MTVGEIRNRKGWEISAQRQSWQWFTGSAFCAVLEEKGLIFTTPKDDG